MQNYKAILLCTFIRLKIFYALLENFIMDYGENMMWRVLNPIYKLIVQILELVERVNMRNNVTIDSKFIFAEYGSWEAG